MILTEQEAKTKWCPEVRVTRRTSHDDVDFSETNRGEDASCDNAHSCLGSACMAWRWADDANGEASYRRTPVKDAAGHFDNAPMGYCGKAGAR